MESQSQSQIVVLAHDASRGVRLNSMRGFLDKFLWKAGDVFTFLSIVHEIQHPLGYMMRLDSPMFAINQKAIDDEIAMKKQEYEKNTKFIEISKLYEMQKVDFKIELMAGPILKNVVVEGCKKINATWVILDKRMKRDKKYFLEKLSSGISLIERNDKIIKIRGPKLSTIQNPKEMLTVDNKNPVTEAQNDEDLFSIEISSRASTSTSTRTSISDAMLTLPMPEGKAQHDQKKCTTCNSTRPTSSAWQTRPFSYMELIDATNRFSSENMIYRGENEIVFHGILKGSKLNVIVKLQNDMKKCKSEMHTLEQTRHEHVIMLLGTCLEENRGVLVFEYACNGSLDQHLSHQNSRPLTWPERMKIAIGACRGLNHLHGNNIIHGDMRPKNIWLTHDFEPLIAGFGLASMKSESRNSSNHCIIGTLGYVAPEYRETGKSTTKIDVYAFGMILLQLSTGRSPTDTRLEGQSLIKWAKALVEESKFSELIDPEIEYDISQVVNMVQLALKCVCKDPHLRLSIKEVNLALDYIKDESQQADEDESQEVNGDVEIIGESQRDIDEKVIYSYGGMTPVPKQAKHFYQGTYIQT